MTAVLNEALKVLRLNQVKDLAGMSRSLIYKLIGEGKFPKQIKLGSRSVGWYAHEVEDWLKSRSRAAHNWSEGGL